MFKTALPLSKGAWFLKKNYFLEKVLIFFIFRPGAFFFESFEETVWQLGENCNLSFHRNLLKEKCSLFVRINFFQINDFDRNIFELEDRLFWTLGGSSYQFRQIFLFCIRRNILDWNIFLNSFFKIIPELSKNHSDSWREIFGRDIQNCKYVFIATSSWKTFSLKKGLFFLYLLLFLSGTFFRFLSKLPRQSWQKCTIVVQKNIHVKQTFWKKRPHLLITDFERFPFEIWPELPTELPKLHIIC